MAPIPWRHPSKRRGVETAAGAPEDNVDDLRAGACLPSSRTPTGEQIPQSRPGHLKLVTIRRLLAPDAQLYVVFADKSARQPSWTGAAGWPRRPARGNVKPLVVRLDTKLRGELNKAKTDNE